MDVLNKLFAQLTDLFKSMTPGARILAGLLLAVIVVSLGYLFNQQVSSGGDLYLMGGRNFSANELPAMEAAFDKAGLSAYTIDGNQIRVPYGKQAAFMGALAESGALPADFHSYLDKAISPETPWASKSQREEKIKFAKQQELALVIKSMAGIENAAVHYDSKKKSGLHASETQTASVTVKPSGTLPLDRNRVQMIRHLVGAAYAGLSPDSVTVIDMNGRTYPAGSPDDPVGGSGEHKALATMEQYQERYKHELLDALAYVPGATVHVNVEIDPKLHFTERKVQVDPKTVEVSATEENRIENTSSAPLGGRPGTAAQQPGANQALSLATASSGNKTESEFTSRRGQNLVSHGETQMEEIGLTPKRITVAVGVPIGYYTKIWHEQHPTKGDEPKKTPNPDELKQIETEQVANIKAHVGHLLPKPIGIVDPVPLVTVTSFHDTLSDAGLLPEAQTSELAMAWLGENWSTLGMGLLAVVSLFMLRSMLRAAPIEPASAAANQNNILSATVTSDSPTGEANEAGEGGAATKKPKRSFGKGPSLKDELVELVRDDPDAAANILKGWIGSPN
ncbi:MAG: flagellar M-ring protein FliF C-terminal domain-containing protein [Pirellulales bacterium]